MQLFYSRKMTDGGTPMELILNTVFPEQNQARTLHQKMSLVPDEGVENELVNLYPIPQNGMFEGFGGAITDAAGYVYSLMPDELKKKVIETYFHPDKMNYQTVRIHMDSCDFSTEMYEADSDPDDEALAHFSFERTEKYILPMLRDAEKAAGRQLDLMLTPWSPPAFMKTNGSRVHGGSLKAEYRKRWAEYICRYIGEFRKRGFRVKRLSVQNEPKAVQTWDSCIFTAEEEKQFLRDYLWPSLKEHGFEDIEVFIWDHNKERLFERVRDTVDEETAGVIAGAAFHWYSGDHFEALDLVRENYPGLKLILSESCIEFTRFAQNEEAIQAVRIAHEIIGDLMHGASAFYDWNLILDEKGGPNHVGNYCGAPFHYNTKTAALSSGLLLDYMGLIARTVSPGSCRIFHTSYDAELDVCAFLRPDKKISLILLNTSDERKKTVIRLCDNAAEILLEPKSIASLLITGCPINAK